MNVSERLDSIVVEAIKSGGRAGLVKTLAIYKSVLATCLDVLDKVQQDEVFERIQRMLNDKRLEEHVLELDKKVDNLLVSHDMKGKTFVKGDKNIVN